MRTAHGAALGFARSSAQLESLREAAIIHVLALLHTIRCTHTSHRNNHHKTQSVSITYTHKIKSS